MILELKPEQQRVMERALKSGMNAEEVLDQAFAVLMEQQRDADWMVAERDSIVAQIEEGYAQSERGELIDGDQAVTMLWARRARRIA